MDNLFSLLNSRARLHYALFYLLGLFLMSCSQDLPKTGWEIDKTEEVLSSFFSGDYEKVYACRSPEFKGQVGYLKYRKHLVGRAGLGKLHEYRITDLARRGGYSYVEFYYTVTLEGMDGVKTEIRDFAVWSGSKENSLCVDLGLRLLYALNSPVKPQNRDYLDRKAEK